jgi:hypothetical protein
MIFVNAAGNPPSTGVCAIAQWLAAPVPSKIAHCELVSKQIACS